LLNAGALNTEPYLVSKIIGEQFGPCTDAAARQARYEGAPEPQNYV